MKQAKRISKSLLDAALQAEIDGKLDGLTSVSWEQITGKPQLADNAWGTPVSSFSALPTAGRFDGDVRLVLDTNDVYTWEASHMKWELIGANDVNVDWGHIQAKPATFPASPHTHAYTSLTGIPSTFTPSAHTHAYDALTGVPSTFTPSVHNHDDRYYTETEVDTKLDTKASAVHTHSELHTHSNKPVLDKIVESQTGTQYDLQLINSHETRLNNIESGYMEGHSHGNLDALNVLTYTGAKPIVDLKAMEDSASALTGKADKSTLSGHVENTTIHVTSTEKNAWNGKADAGHTHSYASLTDVPGTFAPSAHSHAYTSLTGIPTAFTPSTHTHAYSTLTGIPSTFVPSAHSHAYNTLTGIPATFTPAAHMHIASDVTGLTPAVDTGETQPVNGAETWYKVIG